MAANLLKALGLEREVLAERLAAPIAQLLTESGAPTTASAVREALLDRNTEIAFPSFTLHRLADEVVTEVVEVTEVVVTTSAGRTLAAAQPAGQRVRRIVQR